MSIQQNILRCCSRHPKKLSWRDASKLYKICGKPIWSSMNIGTAVVARGRLLRWNADDGRLWRAVESLTANVNELLYVILRLEWQCIVTKICKKNTTVSYFKGTKCYDSTHFRQHIVEEYKLWCDISSLTICLIKLHKQSLMMYNAYSHFRFFIKFSW